MVSLPAPAVIVSAPAPEAVTTSLPAVNVIESAPAPVVKEATLPEPGVNLMAPVAAELEKPTAEDVLPEKSAEVRVVDVFVTVTRSAPVTVMPVNAVSATVTVFSLEAPSSPLETIAKGNPKDKRHIKSSYANSTPATDGKHVVALFGSEGLFCYTVQGEFLWKKDIGRMDVGAYDLPSYEWGAASSPIIHGGKVIVQCDQQKGSFLLAADLKTGKTVWKTFRDELPSWGTPNVVPGKQREELVTNGSNFIRGYDPATGAELWRLGGSSKITAPTPVFGEGLIIVASGRAPASLRVWRAVQCRERF
ncbi:MAG: hypothetical protein EBU23_17390 [Mycobacteriaceae bacterium]|nr:hypothetical protein [Mycobacteriaceae bacterium]